MPCSNAAKTRDPLKLAGVPQTNEISQPRNWRKRCEIEARLLDVANMKWYIGLSTIASFLVTFNDLQDYFTHRNTFKMQLFVQLCGRLMSGDAPFVARPFVKRFALCYQTCPACLSLTLVYCGQTVGRIKMIPGMQVGLGPEYTVLDGDPARAPPKVHSPPIFGTYVLWPKWLDGSRCHLVGR